MNKAERKESKMDRSFSKWLAVRAESNMSQSELLNYYLKKNRECREKAFLNRIFS